MEVTAGVEVWLVEGKGRGSGWKKGEVGGIEGVLGMGCWYWIRCRVLVGKSLPYIDVVFHSPER